MKAGPSEAPGAAADPSVRGLLAVAAVLVFLAGVQLFVFPLRTADYFAWTIGSPMTAVFLGASYWSAVGLEASGAIARQWRVARVAMPAVFVFTSLTLVVTLVHLDAFHLGADQAPVTRAVTWAWIGVYAGVPLLMVLAWWRQVRGRTASGGDPTTPLPSSLRALLAVVAVVLLAAGVALLVAPEWAAGGWAWALTPLTARAVGAWCVGLGIAAGHAWLVDDVASLRPIGVTGVLFGVLQGVALARHGDEVTWASLAATGYLTALAAVTVAGAWLLLLSGRARAEAGAG